MKSLLACIFMWASCLGCSGQSPGKLGKTTPVDSFPIGFMGRNADEIVWRPSTNYPGVQVADLEGGSGTGPYTLRGRFPDGYVERPHWHPTPSHVTVLAGVVHLGFGGEVSRAKMRTFGPGAFFIIPASTPHFLRMEAEAVLQNHGTGPYEVVFLDPKDDPRRK